MTKTIFITLLAFGLNATAQSRINGNGNMTTKNVTTPTYDKVSVSGFYDVILIAGSEGNIAIEAESNLIEHVLIQSDVTTLKIAAENGKKLSTSPGKSITITVPFESLSGVSLAGSGDVKTKSPIKTSEFEATLTGSGDVTLELEAASVQANVTGSGDLVLKGNTESFQCELTGSGDLDAYGLKSANVKTQVTGSGDCKVFCSGTLEARVSGSGDIRYKGDPKKTDNKVSGSGSISKA